MTDLNEWQTNIDAHDVHGSGDVLGSKPKGTPTKKKLASCRPEVVTGYTRQIQFTDSNSDNAAFGDYAFWKYIDDNQGSLLFGYLTCDELFFGLNQDWTLDIDDTRVDDSDENAVFEGVIEWKSKSLAAPIDLAGLDAILV